MLAAAILSQACSASQPVSHAARSAGARNAIVFIGDGLGITTYTAARLWKVGASGRLAIDTLPHTAICSTYSFDGIVTDSSASATALLAGTKTRSGFLNMSPGAPDGDGSPPEPVQTIAELAHRSGRAIGIVTTTAVTHATPASAYAHILDRDLETEIAAQLVSPVLGCCTPDVILGGGRLQFLPGETRDPEYPDLAGERVDGRNLIEELENLGYTYVWNRVAFEDVDSATTTKLVGLFEPSHMRFESERKRDAAGEPSLTEMMERALRILSRRDAGYLLLVEGGRIDHAMHGNSVAGAIRETIAFDDAIARALELTDPAETLILVTADHSHGLVLNGYPPLVRVGDDAAEDIEATRRNLLGSGGIDSNGRPYPTLTFATGPGAIVPRPQYSDRPALVPLRSAAHSGEDVFIAARGPGAERVRGFLTNTNVFDIVRAALGL